MCISATVSYSAATVLVATGVYALRQSLRLPAAYRFWALVPVFFGVQQIFEGLVWQALDADPTGATLTFALGFHFFSHFLWLWWLPVCSYLVEPARLRRRVFAGLAMFGAFSGTLVYTVMLLHPEWMTVVVKGHSIVYDYSVPWQSPIHLSITPVMLYGMTILLPLLLSSHRHILLFGILVLLSMALASVAYNQAFISVWCFFAAVLSLYLVHMMRAMAGKAVSGQTATAAL